MGLQSFKSMLFTCVFTENLIDPAPSDRIFVESVKSPLKTDWKLCESKHTLCPKIHVANHKTFIMQQLEACSAIKTAHYKYERIVSNLQRQKYFSTKWTERANAGDVISGSWGWHKWAAAAERKRKSNQCKRANVVWWVCGHEHLCNMWQTGVFMHIFVCVCLCATGKVYLLNNHSKQ